MKFTRNPHRLVFAAILAEANVFLISAYLWGPSHTPNWIRFPYAVMTIIGIIVFLLGERSSITDGTSASPQLSNRDSER